MIQLREGAGSSDGLLLPSCAIGISASNSERVLPHGLEGFEWVGSMSRTTALRAEVFNITDSVEKDLCSAPTYIEEEQPQYQFIACVSDHVDRDFRVGKRFKGDNSLDTCSTFCHELPEEYAYFALQGDICFCGSQYGRLQITIG